MNVSLRTSSLALLATAVALLSVPALASAASNGGVTPGGEGGVAPGDGSAVQLNAKPSATVGKPFRISGSIADGSGRSVTIQGRRPRGAWQPVVTTRAGSSGSFATSWTPKKPGELELRAVAGGGGETSATGSTSSSPRKVTIYRMARATWYGPRFYGNRMACGGRLTTRTLGVAHRTLPCGTRVAFRYNGRSITVPVVDRGPYSNGADWDLTSATASRLGFTHTARIAAAPLSSSR
jgi:rare lipoprotein A